MDKIIVTTKLNLNDYIKANYHLAYRRWTFKLITGIGIFLLLILLTSINELTEFPWLPLGFGLFMTIGLPISLYFASKRNYKSDGRISETIVYEFDSDNFLVTGESFNSKLSWSKVYSVTESEDWIVIWQNKQMANLVPKRDFKDGELQQLKSMIQTHTNIKTKFKS